MTNKSSRCSSTGSHWRRGAQIRRQRHRSRYGYLRYWDVSESLSVQAQWQDLFSSVVSLHERGLRACV
jgi:hypothetical protein